METAAKRHFILSPKLQVIATWGWNFISIFIIMAVASVFMPTNISVNRQAMEANPGLALIPIAAELVATGLLPVLFTLFVKERPATYGLHRQGLGKSLLLSTLVVMLFATAVYAGIERIRSINFADLRISSIWRLIAFMVGAFAYGPLEVFFVIWLVHNTDRVFHSESQILSAGLVVTILIYGLLHAFSQGFYAILIAARYLAFGWIYKATRNAIGPMLAGAVTNEFIWFLLNAFLSMAQAG